MDIVHQIYSDIDKCLRNFLLTITFLAVCTSILYLEDIILNLIYIVKFLLGSVIENIIKDKQITLNLDLSF